MSECHCVKYATRPRPESVPSVTGCLFTVTVADAQQTPSGHGEMVCPRNMHRGLRDSPISVVSVNTCVPHRDLTVRKDTCCIYPCDRKARTVR